MSDIKEVTRPITDTDVRYYGSCVYSVCSVKPRSHCLRHPTLTHARGCTAIADRLLEKKRVPRPTPPPPRRRVVALSNSERRSDMYVVSSMQFY